MLENSGAMLSALPDPEEASEIEPAPPLKERGIYGFDSIDPRSRSFNLMRSRILELRQARDWRMFGIVSATPQVGKSFIAANLAAALSRTPKVQTYLLDLDLRRGSVSDLCGLEGHGDVHEYLNHSSDVVRPAAYRFKGESLVVIPTKPEFGASSELLAGQRAQNLFQAMRASAENNIFIVDLPPVFANDDATIAMVRLDAYIVVAEEGKTTERELKDVIGMLGRERLAGTILNKYHGGLMSEGYGVSGYYNDGYAAG